MKSARRKTASATEETADKAEKASFNWAKLIVRIYEVNSLICHCGKEIKITAFVTHPAEIRRILNRMGWSTEIPKFDPLYNFSAREICQLIPGTEDGFFYNCCQGPDPPFMENGCDPPHSEDEFPVKSTAFK